MSQVEQVRISIEQKKSMIELGDAVTRISKNRDWKKLVDAEFFDSEPKRLVSLLAHPGMQDEASQVEIRNQMLAIAYFRQYLARTEMFAEQARASLPADQQTEVELLEEDVQE
jgi:hypothetical protein